MANSLLKHSDWTKLPVTEDGGDIWQSVGNPSAYMWIRSDSMLLHDDIDKKFEAATDVELSDMIFLSKHASGKGFPALTVHPIGNPGRAEAKAGGKPGLCVPPSPRLSPLYRRLYRAVQASDLAGEFPVSLEATHHGPWVKTPALFAEIGSSEEEWTRADAALLWAKVLSQELRLGRESEGGGEWWEERDASASKRAVLLCVGGGHYAPKHGDLARREGNFLGHILASYSLDFESAEGDKAWQEPLREALRATRQAFSTEGGEEGGGKREEVYCFVDKKAFKGPQRKALQAFIEGELGAKWAVKPSDLPTAGPAKQPRTTTFARGSSPDSYSDEVTESST